MWNPYHSMRATWPRYILPLTRLGGRSQSSSSNSTSYFVSPPPKGPNGDFAGNVVYEQGSTQSLEWVSSLTDYAFALYQQNLSELSASPVTGPLISGLSGSQSGIWVVSPADSNISFSPVYFFWVAPNRTDGFISHYFNITVPSSTSSVPSSTSTPASSRLTAHSTSSTTSTVHSTSRATVTTSSTTSSSPAITLVVTSTPKPSSGSSNLGLGVGVGIGIAAVLILVALVGWWLLRRRRRAKEEPNGDDAPYLTAMRLEESEQKIHETPELVNNPLLPQIYYEAPGQDLVWAELEAGTPELEAGAVERKKL